MAADVPSEKAGTTDDDMNAQNDSLHRARPRRYSKLGLLLLTDRLRNNSKNTT
jgi:hypothetical protein